MTNDAIAAARAYRERSIEGASPARILRLLLEGAIRRVDRASTIDPKDARSSFVGDLARAGEIVVELRMAIQPEAAPELAVQTTALYDFALERIEKAMNDRDHEPLRAAREVLGRLHDAWKRIDEGVQ